jgi:Leucine-rich repeat (LRR) protein
LGGNQFSGDFSMQIKDFPRMSSLVLKNNKFTSVTSSSATVSLLDLSGNQISGNVHLLDSFVNSFPNLISLSLARNPISATIPDSMGGLRNLKTLDLSSTKVFGALPNSFTKLSKLENLQLNQSLISGKYIRAMHMWRMKGEKNAFLHSPAGFTLF